MSIFIVSPAFPFTPYPLPPPPLQEERHGGQTVCNIHLFWAFWKYGLWEGKGETTEKFEVIPITVGFRGKGGLLWGEEHLISKSL